jgi:hypothetical protein
MRKAEAKETKTKWPSGASVKDAKLITPHGMLGIDAHRRYSVLACTSTITLMTEEAASRH